MNDNINHTLKRLNRKKGYRSLNTVNFFRIIAFASVMLFTFCSSGGGLFSKLTQLRSITVYNAEAATEIIAMTTRAYVNKKEKVKLTEIAPGVWQGYLPAQDYGVSIILFDDSQTRSIPSGLVDGTSPGKYVSYIKADDYFSPCMGLWDGTTALYGYGGIFPVGAGIANSTVTTEKYYPINGNNNSDSNAAIEIDYNDFTYPPHAAWCACGPIATEYWKKFQYTSPSTYTNTNAVTTSAPNINLTDTKYYDSNLQTQYGGWPTSPTCVSR